MPTCPDKVAMEVAAVPVCFACFSLCFFWFPPRADYRPYGGVTGTCSVFLVSRQ